MRYQGRIADWKDDKGFGFVIPNGGGERAFVHINEFVSRGRRPSNGDVISYELVLDAKRRQQPKRVRFGGDERPVRHTAIRPGGKSDSKPIAYGLAIGGLSAVTALVMAGRLPILIAIDYWALSVVSLIAYPMDKSAANRGDQRLSESSLHLITILGGWPEPLIAQQLFRHKMKKRQFRAAFWIAVLLNIVAVAFLLTPLGAGLLIGR